MEKNTVLLELKEYDKMKTLNDEVFKYGKIYVEGHGLFQGEYQRYYFTKDEAVKDIAQANIDLKRDYEILHSQNFKLRMKLEDKCKPREITLEQVKKMNYWEFIKWKREQVK